MQASLNLRKAWATTQVADYLRSGRSCVVQKEEAGHRLSASSIGAAGRGHGSARWLLKEEVKIGAVAEMCEEYETLHDRSGRPDDVMEQPINCVQ